MMQAQEVLNFWFSELSPQQQFAKSDELDALITTRFSELLAQAIAGELADWRLTAEGRLAEILVLDQFSRNIYRDQPQAFSQDPQALALAQEAIAHGANETLVPEALAFLYMPFMHSESRIIHQIAEQLFSEQGLETSLAFELQHKKIIDQFGRYPHRNAVLGRTSTAEEIAFLTQADSSF